MIIEGNNKDNLKPFSADGSAKKPKGRLNPGVQRIILENATVNRIQGDIDYANGFLFQSFRLLLRMEEA